MRLQPGKNPPHTDMVSTPRGLADAIVQHFAPHGRLLDPARGTSHSFYDAMCVKRGVYDDVDWCEELEGRDFFAWTERADWVVTNPPWSKLREFLKHAMSLSDDVVFLVTMNHLFTRARMRDVHESGFGLKEALLVDTPPAPWPSSGFQLAATHLRRGHVGGLQLNRRLLK